MSPAGVLAYVNDSDARVTWRPRGWRPPRWFRAWMIVTSRLADGWIYLPLAVSLGFGDTPCHRAVAAGFVAAAFSNLTLLSLKRGVKRLRPCEVLGVFPHFDVRPPDRFSFPSGHSMNAFAVGTVLALQFPALAPLLLALAASVAASRVVLGLHYPSDVVAGSLIGALIGVVTFALLLG